MLIESFISFCEKKYKENLGAEEAENGLLSFLTDSGHSGLHMASNSAQAPVIPFTQDNPQKKVRYLVGAFIQHLQDTSSSIWDYLDRVAKGYMLANAVFFPELTNAHNKYRSTHIFFDTQFLIYALGYCGDAQREPCIELLELLYLTGQSKELHGPSAQHFMSQHYTAADIAIFRQRLEKDLEKLGIWVVDKPTYAEVVYQIDEEQLGKELHNALTYVNPAALERDVDSISAIMRLRRGLTSRQIEGCKALFISTNATIARIAREFCQRGYDRMAIPPCLTDHVVTTLVWLKSPLKKPQLPMKRIIADCYAATQPDDRLWAKYMAEIARRAQMPSSDITPEDIINLKYETAAYSALMETTLGDDREFSVGTVPEIINRVRLKHQEEVLTELEEQRRLRQEEKKAEDTRQERVRQRAQKVAHIVANIIKWGLWIVLIAGAFYAISGGSPLSQTSTLRYILSVIFGLLGAFAIINLMHNKPLDAIIIRLEKHAGEKIEQWLHNLTR